MDDTNPNKGSTCFSGNEPLFPYAVSHRYRQEGQEALNGGQSTTSGIDTDHGAPSLTSQGTKLCIRKRQLPPWMLGVTGAESVAVSGKKENAQKLIKGKQSEEAGKFTKISGKTSKSASSKRSKAGGAAIKTDDISNSEDNSSNKADENKVKKGRTQTNAVSANRHSRKGAARTHKKKQHCESDHMQNHISEVDEDKEVENGFDLTVEDLISMAKEHIEAEEQREFQGARPVPEVQLEESKKAPKKATSIFRSDEWRDLSYNMKGSESISPATKNTSKDLCKDNNIGREEIRASVIQSQSNATLGELGMSDDVTQNMLGLLLGPAVGPSRNENTASQFLLKETSIPDTTELSSTTEEQAPLLKKKSSLRDKVTMLLN